MIKKNYDEDVGSRKKENLLLIQWYVYAISNLNFPLCVRACKLKFGSFTKVKTVVCGTILYNNTLKLKTDDAD